MANFGPNTNNSQFFITRNDCPNLDGNHVVFGHVLRGFDIIQEMEKVATDEGTTTAEILIVDCGELGPDQRTWNFYDPDDELPPFPADWLEAPEHTHKDHNTIYALLERIKLLGNAFFNKGDIVAALRKYKKVGRYHQFFVDAHANSDRGLDAASDQFVHLRINNLLNMAACHLKLGQFQLVLSVCDEVLRSHPDQSKAYYRRGVALIELKDYERALEDLRQAHALAPNNNSILEQFNRGKALLMEYRKKEKLFSQKMCKELNL